METLIHLLPKAWLFSELPGYRESPENFATYSGFSYESLPPIEDVLDDFGWLRHESPKLEWSLSDDTEAIVRKFQQLAGIADLILPPAFTTFLNSPELQPRIRSCTACYLEMPDYIVPTIGMETGNLIHFLSDQQWCLHWNLYINSSGEHCVICSTEAYGFAEAEQSTVASKPSPVNLLEENVVFCAASFQEFLYRFWIENEIWFAITKEVALTAKQRTYAEYYRKQSAL